ncbi:MAG: family oxidoreductase [Chloroflexi bacterium]|nr:family oxidoreductase [Chloroflexota bacterium]
MEHALVGGGAGFIGSHLCAALVSRGLSVTCVDNLSTGTRDNIASLLNHQHFTLLTEDISLLDTERWVRGDMPAPNYIFHLASPASVVDYLRLPVETLMVNSQGTHRLLDLARACGSRFLFTSTSEIYGDPLVHPQSEEYWGNVSPNGPRSCYDESKRFAEALTMQYWRSYGVDIRIVRIFNTYGPHSRLDDGRVVPNFIGQALAGEPITIYGDGKQTRSFCYVSDLVAGLLATMFTENVAGQVFNLGNPEEHTIVEFAEIVSSLVAEFKGRDGQDERPLLEWRDLPIDDPTRRRPDIEKAHKFLGWEPSVRLQDGLRQTISWFGAGHEHETISAVRGAHGAGAAE